MLILFGAPNETGTTKQALDLVFHSHSLPETVYLAQHPVAHFHHKSQYPDSDAFLSLVEKVLHADTVIFATPVYWNSISSLLKVFIDRMADLLISHPEKTKQLEGKTCFLVSAYSTATPLGYAGVEFPIHQMCLYFNMKYGGAFFHYTGTDNGEQKQRSAQQLEIIREQLFSALPARPFSILGAQLHLRPALVSERQEVYEWIYCSDLTPSFCGAPLFPEKEIPTWKEFDKSWKSVYFQGDITPMGRVLILETPQGEKLGAIAFHPPDAKGRSEVDISLRELAVCGRGYGRDALQTLSQYLYAWLGIHTLWMQPSLRNPRSIRCVEAAGFRHVPFSSEFGPPDYPDSVYLSRDARS